MPGPLLTADVTGNPWVEVFFDPGDLDPDCVRLRIYRQSENRTWLVRGGVDVATGVAALDFEAPFQTTSSYRAAQYDVAGEFIAYTESSDTVLDVDGTWIHNPLEPAGGIFVELDDESAREISRPTPGELVYPEAAEIPHRIGSIRRGVEGASVVFNIDGVSNMTKFDEMLGAYGTQKVGVLCLRTSDPVMWPRTFFVAADAFPVTDKTIRFGGDWVQVRASCDEVQPPYEGLVVPLLTYDDLDAAYADYDARDAAYATYTEQDRDYSLAGLA
jgi:hypothetical protein